MSDPASAPRRPRADRPPVAVAWLLTDMLVVNLMTVIVKQQGAQYPVVQLVFLRAVVGLLVIAPLIVRYRSEIAETRRVGRHLSRVACNAIALVGNFAAFTALPLALVTALGFVRPLVAMMFAGWLLGERIGSARWIGAMAGLLGVAIVLGPTELAFNAGLIGVAASVTFGSLATVQARMLRDENTTVMMVFYTVGLAVLTAPFALWTWRPVALDDAMPLLLIGIMAQIGQFCFLRAYQSAPASTLAPYSYLSIVFATAFGYLFFGETLGWNYAIGIVIVLSSVRLAARKQAP